MVAGYCERLVDRPLLDRSVERPKPLDQLFRARSTGAMVEAGMPPAVAKDLVIQSQSQLIRSGVVEPTRIPWGGK